MTVDEAYTRLTNAGATVILMVPNLENDIMDYADISGPIQGVGDDMAKQFKERVQIGLNESGTPAYKWATGSTRHALQASIARIIMETNPGQHEGNLVVGRQACVTVAEFIGSVYMPTFTKNLAPTTRENYRLYIALNILPFLGEMPMDEVTVATIQQFYDWMASAAKRGRKQNLNRKTIERVGGLASRIFKVASEMKVIPESPFKKTLLTIRADEAGHHEALPDAVVYGLKKAIPLLENRDERLYMAMLVYTGMRPEEVRGIAWEDLDLEGQYGRIVRAVTYPNNNHAHIGKPKTNRSGRTVLLAKPLVEILRPEQQSFGFVCGGEQPWCYSKAARVSVKAFRHLEIEGYTDYDFRATFGTQLKEMGMTSAQVADVMGHADTRMVETVYARARHEGIMKRLADVERLNV